LKPEGETLHGVECLDRTRRKDYDEMTAEEFQRYVGVDGHVGMEDQAAIRERFQREFAHVIVEPRFSVCQNVEEFIKQADDYGTPICERDFLEYLKLLDFNERRAFNMAMGYVFDKLSELSIRLPDSEYVFVKASSSPFETLYNSHRDHSTFSSIQPGQAHARVVALDRHPNSIFGPGWYEAESFPPVGRWMAGRASLTFKADRFSKLRFDMTSHIPDLRTEPLTVNFRIDGREIGGISIIESGWMEVELGAPCNGAPSTARDHQFEIIASRTWKPRDSDPISSDARDLSVAISNLELIF
jgi:hypothetical protein